MVVEILEITETEMIVKEIDKDNIFSMDKNRFDLSEAKIGKTFTTNGNTIPYTMSMVRKKEIEESEKKSNNWWYGV